MEDYNYYILSKYSANIADVYVSNNAEYTSLFYKWLKQYNALTADIRRFNYYYCDACDFNNIYIWLLASNNVLSESLTSNIILDCNNKKTATSELIPCNPVEVYFVPYIIKPTDAVSDHFSSTVITENLKKKIKIKIIKQPINFISNTRLKEKVKSIINEYFANNRKLGTIISVDKINELLYDTGYIKDIKTIYIDGEETHSVGGLTFAAFTPVPISNRDFEIVYHSKKLLPFQCGRLYEAVDLSNYIEIEDDTSISIFNDGF